MLIGPNAKSLVKENIYYDSLLIRKEIRTGQTPYYYEIYKETSETTDSSNLIVNSGFEEYKKLPDGSGQLDICVRGWYNAGTGKATYYTKYTDNQYASSPINSNGYQMPHDGSAYAGINTQSQEYIMISLKDTLQKDSLYCVELYVSKAENSSAGIAELGAIFSAEKKIIRANEPAIPHITFTSRSGFNDTESWMRTCTTFTAEGYELYIILGSFKEKPIAHYYIDDISIRAVKSAIDCNCIEEITFDQLSYYDFKVGMNIRMAFVTFEQSKSVLTASSYIELDNFAAMMQEHKTMIAELASHTFNSGNIESDKQLTSARAKAIWDYLVKKGIAANRIKYKGYGSTEPIADNSTEEGKSKNDRVEIRIISL
ncbi:MAG: OmpA family protein [Bacteroidia bacterium]|nr:OmpA family protein [Bacteroidia bacterium]